MPCTLILGVGFSGSLKLSFPPPCAPARGQGLCSVLDVRKRGCARRPGGGRAGAGRGTVLPMLRDVTEAQQGQGGVIISPGKCCWPRVERWDAVSTRGSDEEKTWRWWPHLCGRSTEWHKMGLWFALRPFESSTFCPVVSPGRSGGSLGLLQHHEDVKLPHLFPRMASGSDEAV